LEKNKSIEALSRKQEFKLLKKESKRFSEKWLKILFLHKNTSKKLKLAWSLPKKYVPEAVTRNRLKRWGRENMKNSSLKGLALIVFFQRSKSFYKNLKRKDFNCVFNCVLEKICTET